MYFKTRMMRMKLLSIAGMLLINLGILLTSSAQQKQALVSIDDVTLLNKIEKQAAQVMNDKAWSMAKLRDNVENLKATDHAKINLPKRGDRLLSSEELYEKRSKGVILVGRYYNCGNCSKMHTSLASGAILNEEGVCVTNYHVLEGIIEKSKVSLLGDSLAFISTMDGKIFPIIQILSYSKAGDAAIFKVDTRGEKFTAIPLGLPAKTGAKVHAITHPKGYYYFYSEGVVARNVTYAEAGPEGQRMEITADYAKGSSGGPIMDSFGNLIGMVSTTSSIYYEDKEQKNLQMVIKSTIPISTIKGLII